MATSRLVELVDRYRSTHGTSESEIARRIGFSREALRKWRIHGLNRLPDRANLAAVARVIGRPYRDSIAAACAFIETSVQPLKTPNAKSPSASAAALGASARSGKIRQKTITETMVGTRLP